jgi:murein L,D-transpeptidase YcbB/YkuD
MSASPFVRAVAAALILGGVAGVPAGFAQPADGLPTPPTGAFADGAALSDEAQEFRAALLGATADMAEPRRAAIAAFYAGRDYAPYWTAAGGAQVAALQAALADVSAHGLPPKRYPAAAGGLTAGPPGDAEAEVAATEAYLRLAKDLSSGILTPSTVDEEIAVEPPRPGDAQLLAMLDTGGVTDARTARTSLPSTRRSTSRSVSRSQRLTLRARRSGSQRRR